MRALTLITLLTLISCSSPKNGDIGTKTVYSTCLNTETNLVTGTDFEGNPSTGVSSVCTNKDEIQVEYKYHNGIQHINKIYLLNNGRIIKEIGR